MMPSDTRWLSHECCGKFARNYLHCCKPFYSYMSYLEMLRHMVHTPFWLVLMVYQAVISSEVLSALALLNLFMQKKIADFSKLPFMLKSILDHLNSIRESDVSWCTAAETAILNLETEHGITIKGSRGRKSPPLTVQQFRVQVAIPYLDTLIANITAASHVR